MIKKGLKKRKFWLLAFSWLTLIQTAATSNLHSPLTSEPPVVEIISLEKSKSNLALLASLPETPDFLFETPTKIYLLAKSQELSLFQRLGLSFCLETPLFPPAQPTRSTLFLTSGGNGDYHSYDEVTKELKNLAQKYPDICLAKEIGRSIEGRALWALKISDKVTTKEAEPAILFLGGHHAREWISVEIPLYLGRYLAENYGSNSLVRNLVDQSQIWIVPLVNPDGLEYSIKFYRYWRKNRRLNNDGSYGVDLNRNYGFNWGIDNRGSSPNPSSETYRGTAPFSEPETRAVRDLFYQYSFVALVSYHSYSQVILFPWGYTTMPPDQFELLFNLSKRMSDLMVKVHGRRYDFGQASTLLYLTNGDTTDWAYGVAGIPAFTIELPPIDILHGGFFNAESDILSIFEENLVAALDLIQECINNYFLIIPSTKKIEREDNLLKDRLTSKIKTTKD